MRFTFLIILLTTFKVAFYAQISQQNLNSFESIKENSTSRTDTWAYEVEFVSSPVLLSELSCGSRYDLMGSSMAVSEYAYGKKRVFIYIDQAGRDSIFLIFQDTTIISKTTLHYDSVGRTLFYQKLNFSKSQENETVTFFYYRAIGDTTNLLDHLHPYHDELLSAGRNIFFVQIRNLNEQGLDGTTFLVNPEQDTVWIASYVYMDDHYECSEYIGRANPCAKHNSFEDTYSSPCFTKMIYDFNKMTPDKIRDELTLILENFWYAMIGCTCDESRLILVSADKKVDVQIVLSRYTDKSQDAGMVDHSQETWKGYIELGIRNETF